MQLFKIALAAIIGLMICAPALAYELECRMTDYGTASRTSGIRELVPPSATHVIEGSDARIAGTSMTGAAQDAGSRIKITYFGTLKKVGETEVTYTFIRSNGVMVAKTRGLKGSPWEQEFPERTGRYLVQGSCRMK